MRRGFPALGLGNTVGRRSAQKPRNKRAAVGRHAHGRDAWNCWSVALASVPACDRLCHLASPQAVALPPEGTSPPAGPAGSDLGLGVRALALVPGPDHTGAVSGKPHVEHGGFSLHVVSLWTAGVSEKSSLCSLLSTLPTFVPRRGWFIVTIVTPRGLRLSSSQGSGDSKADVQMEVGLSTAD